MSKGGKIIMVSGVVVDYDRWNRFRVMYPDAYSDTRSDTLNTRLQLEAFDKQYKKRNPDCTSTPLDAKHYVVKHTAGMIVATRSCMQVPLEPASMISKWVEIEVELCTFDIQSSGKKGWYIKGRIMTVDKN
jgi:hypothetical protein